MNCKFMLCFTIVNDFLHQLLGWKPLLVRYEPVVLLNLHINPFNILFTLNASKLLFTCLPTSL